MRKKMVSLLLALVMLLSLAVPAFAAEAGSALDVVFADIISSYEPEDIVTQDVLDALYALAMGEEAAVPVDDEADVPEDAEPAADADVQEAPADEPAVIADVVAADAEPAEGDTETTEPEPAFFSSRDPAGCGHFCFAHYRYEGQSIVRRSLWQ